MHGLQAPVEALMREAGASILLPRFRALRAEDIEEKAPGDLVTIADRESEARLTDGLAKLLPGSAVVG
ncbi:MAG TPA: inositol monophosphatase, partial [Sphingomonas sp.]|nr:inositol monophosphatase [Sphingomonas sp.]